MTEIMAADRYEGQTAARVAWIDNARALACTMVVALHAAAPYLYQFPDRSAPEWVFANLVDSFTRACVPLFFMISGYFFLTDTAPRRRNFLRIGTALAFYSVVALAYRWLVGQDISLRTILSIAVSPAFYHLWFFYAIITVYFLMTIVRLREGGAGTMAMIIAAMLVLNPSLFDISAALGFDVELASPGFLDGSLIYYFGYACIGGCFRRLEPDRSRSGVAVGLLLIYVVSSVGIMAATHVASVNAGTFASTFYAYENSLVILQSVALFGAIHQSGNTWPFARRLAAVSLPVYGLHAVVLDRRNGLGVLDMEVSAFVALPVSFVVALAISAALGGAIRRLDRARLIH